MLHMDGLEGSWEVMNSRAEAQGKALVPGAQDLPLPGDAIIARDLRIALGDLRIEMTERVKDFILLYARQRRTNTEAMLGVASIYAPVIDRRLTELRLPRALGLLPAALSAFHLRAVSEDGSAGLWMLNHYVATKQGLVCNASIDERRDLYKSTRAALDYLYELHQLYGDWTMALTAYTCGPAGVTRARLRAENPNSFAQLYPFLPASGRDFVPAFAAAVYVMTNHKQLGMTPLPMQAMPLPDKIQLQEPLRFKHVANVLGIPEGELRTLNPVCRTEVIPGIGMPVQLCLPQGYGPRFTALKDSIYTVQSRTAALEEPVKPAKPATEGASAETNEAPKPKPVPSAPKPYVPPTGTVPVTYTIKSGDNIGLIAQWFGVPARDLKAMNQLTSDRITAGDKLTVHVIKSKAAAMAKVDAMSFAEKQAMVGAAAPTPKVEVQPAPAGTTIHTVKQGESLWLIAKQYPGVTPEAIMKANGIGDKLQPGMKLKIPKGSK